jgi:hypothetical protein
LERYVQIKTIKCSPTFELDDSVLLSEQPVVLKGLVSHWPIVSQAKKSETAVVDYFKSLYKGRPVTVVRGEPEIKGRISYTSDLSKINCTSLKVSLPDALKLILAENGENESVLHYIGTVLTDSLMPEFRLQNDITVAQNAKQYMWLGGRSCISTHYDLPDNLACNVVGRRRFTLFPPDQLENLYVGPLDFTPAGQPISLVDVRNPDLSRFPKYAEAQKSAMVAELALGDALFLPSMWWHNVEGLDRFNVLVNYWWRQTPDFMSSPTDVLDLALLSIRDLPPAQKKVWKNILEYYIFNEDDNAFEHIPTPAKGSVGEMTDIVSRKIRAKVLSRLNR